MGAKSGKAEEQSGSFRATRGSFHWCGTASGWTKTSRISWDETSFQKSLSSTNWFWQIWFSAQCKARTLLRLGMDRRGFLHTEECRLRMVQRLQETEYGRKRIQIAEKRENVRQKKKQRKGRNFGFQNCQKFNSKTTLEVLHQVLESRGQTRIHLRIQGWSQIPVELNWIPRRKKVQAQHNHLEGPSEMQTKQVLQSNLWMMRQLSPIYCFLIVKVLLEHFMLNFKNPQFYPFVRSNLTLILKHLGIMMTFLESPWTLRWPKQRDVKSAKLFRQWASWEPIPRPKNEKVISTRWVDVNKGDEQRPKYRSRLVARELKAKSGQSETHWSDFFASMPPITALRILSTIAVTKKIPNKDGKLIPLDPTMCLIFIDIKKAHFWSPARRRLLVEMPPEMGYLSDIVGLLKKSLYGTRDAPANWEAAIKDDMLALVDFFRRRAMLVCISMKSETSGSKCMAMISLESDRRAN